MQEKTLILYKELGIRLQLVELSLSSGWKEYQIRLNRRIDKRFSTLEGAIPYFRGKIYSYVQQIKLF